MARRFALLLAATAALLAPAGAKAAGYVPGEVVVRFHGEEQGRIVNAPRGVGVGDAAAALRANPRVATATANYVATASAEPFMPNDPGASGVKGGWAKQQWNFLDEAGVRAPTAWGNAIAAGRPGASGVRIAILDTGIAYRADGRYRRSPDLSAGAFLRGYDFVDDDSRPSDENGHGTHIASTIAERTGNATALTGLAYRARLIPVRVLDRNGSGNAATIARAIRYASARRAQIINLSLEFDSDVRAAQIPEVISAIRYARRRGALIVSASGNEGADRVAFPGRATGVVAVGATTERGCLSEYSNRGTGLDLVAPGGGGADVLFAQKGCEDSGGRDIYQLTFNGDPRRFGYPGGYEGTSMAAAHVSGAAALVIATGSAGRRPSPDALEQRLETTARDLGEQGWDEDFGAGLLDAGLATEPPG